MFLVPYGIQHLRAYICSERNFRVLVLLRVIFRSLCGANVTGGSTVKLAIYLMVPGSFCMSHPGILRPASYHKGPTNDLEPLGLRLKELFFGFLGVGIWVEQPLHWLLRADKIYGI
jgi:hypothetical protein